MKKEILVFLAIALIWGAGASIACAQSPGMYFSGNVGALLLEDSDVTWFDGVRDEAEFDTGLGITGAIGYDFGTGLRTEFEIGLRFNDVDRQFPDGLGGDFSSFSAMGNAFFDLMPGYRVSPFIGAGAGIANVAADVDFWGEDDDNVFAYQFMAGVSFAVAYNMKIDFQYRYFATEDPDFEFFEAEYKTHALMGGVRINF
ncbi:MAG: porin family protein [Desulfobacteraceae bacterium]|nr:MAG: porin family protein [Desulfobacteraceae bacterium]